MLSFVQVYNTDVAPVPYSAGSTRKKARKTQEQFEPNELVTSMRQEVKRIRTKGRCERVPEVSCRGEESEVE
jgi:hypothetical protein